VGNLADELALTERCLRKHPKSYPTWHHRKWCVARAARGEDSESEQVSSLLETELSMSKSLLDLDDRNFHGWGYRRFVVALMSTRGGGSNANRHEVGEGVGEISTASALSELRYSEEKIERNFSNYSAWHHRAACLPRAFSVSSSVAGDSRETNANEGGGAETSGGDDERENASKSDRNFPRPSSAFVPERVLANEYALVRQALFTEPEDQAGWMYHRWLTAQTKNANEAFAAPGEDAAAAAAAKRDVFAGEADALRELCALEPDCKWPALTLARLCDLQDTEAGAAESAARFAELARLDPARRGFYCDCCRV
jgi:geranylgeranyl transferase type-2 subunit alpha